MEFCSKYGYNYGNSGSDLEEVDEEETVNNKIIKKKVRKADSNIVKVKFDHLTLSNETFPGEPIKCNNCEAIMTLNSRRNLKSEKSNHIWNCEYCYHENDITKRILSLDEVPTKDNVTFLLEPAPVKPIDVETPSKAKSLDDSFLTYCIDISGSMNADINDQISSRNADYRPTFMSRLMGVKIACAENLSKLKDEEPNRRVNLVTFSDSVDYYGDCTRAVKVLHIDGTNENSQTRNTSQVAQKPRFSFRNSLSFFNLFSSTSSKTSTSRSTTSAPENLYDCFENKEKMLKLAENQDSNLKRVSESHESIQKLIKNLKTEGCTALGPALVFSIGFCSKKHGSQIILCTDGCANRGMGSIENNKKSEQFYEELADYAKQNGVSVNVLTMRGTDCKLSLLGKVADKSNGTVHIVDPKNLSDTFKSIIDNRIIATNVVAKLIINKKYLYLRTEELEKDDIKAINSNDLDAKKAVDLKRTSKINKDIGNATTDTELIFEYGIRKLPNAENSPSFKELPFQLQITYTAPDGSKGLRVITLSQEFTTDREQAERNILNTDLIWANTDQKMSAYVLESNVGFAKIKSKQMSNFRMKNNIEKPDEYSQREDFINKLSLKSNLMQLNDVQSEQFYSAKKNTGQRYFKKK